MCAYLPDVIYVDLRGFEKRPISSRFLIAITLDQGSTVDGTFLVGMASNGRPNVRRPVVIWFVIAVRWTLQANSRETLETHRCRSIQPNQHAGITPRL